MKHTQTVQAGAPETQTICPNCGQWQNDTKERAGVGLYRDCFNDCAERGLAQKRKLPTTDEVKLKTALLDLGKADYEKVRAELIGRLGYDSFRDMQNRIFKQIGTIATA